MGKMMEAAPRRQEMRDEDLLRQVLQPDFGQMHTEGKCSEVGNPIVVLSEAVFAGNLLNVPMQQHHIVTIDDDVYGWLLSQASALRARDHFSLDWDNLAEELEEMAALRRDALQSDLEILLLHCLKLACETRPTQRRWRERQWKLDVAEHRNRIKRLLRSSGTLRAEFESFIPEAYRLARKDAGLLIDPDQKPVGPEQCPWASEQIQDEDFFPSSIKRLIP